MAQAKKVSIAFTTPVGNLSFIHAVKPDLKYGPTYQVTYTPTADADTLISRMESLNPAFKGKIPFKKNADGTVSFKIKQKRYITWFDKDGKKQEKECIPVLLNADQSPFTGTENPWGGSTGEVAMRVDLSKDQQQNPIVALRLVGIRFHSVQVGGEGGGVSDPLFGGGKPKSDEPDVTDDAPEFEADFEDDIPF